MNKVQHVKWCVKQTKLTSEISCSTDSRLAQLVRHWPEDLEVLVSILGTISNHWGQFLRNFFFTLPCVKICQVIWTKRPSWKTQVRRQHFIFCRVIKPKSLKISLKNECDLLFEPIKTLETLKSWKSFWDSTKKIHLKSKAVYNSPAKIIRICTRARARVCVCVSELLLIPLTSYGMTSNRIKFPKFFEKKTRGQSVGRSLVKCPIMVLQYSIRCRDVWHFYRPNELKNIILQMFSSDEENRAKTCRRLSCPVHTCFKCDGEKKNICHDAMENLRK